MIQFDTPAPYHPGAVVHSLNHHSGCGGATDVGGAQVQTCTAATIGL